MGYVKCNPTSLLPSYYRLNDGTGTIVSAICVISHLAPNPFNAPGFGIVSKPVLSTFVPLSSRTPEKFTPFEYHEISSGIIDEDVDYEILSEEFVTYELGNGRQLKARTVIDQVKKTKFFTQIGEPVYNIGTNLITKLTKNP
ncbi:MAG: hypothetical protein MPJ05_00690 [Nitrosopumilus sp.]|nr:hypothetical protein [Nitrosopumilus sp.]MDA7952328.1 hypothetical protein [Nitrosopumilus sp.]